MRKLIYIILSITIIFILFNFIKSIVYSPEIAYKELELKNSQNTYIKADSVFLNDLRSYLDEKYLELDNSNSYYKSEILIPYQNNHEISPIKKTFTYKSTKQKCFTKTYRLNENNEYPLEISLNKTSKLSRKGHVEFYLITEKDFKLTEKNLHVMIGNDTLQTEIIQNVKLLSSKKLYQLSFPFAFKKKTLTNIFKNNNFKLKLNKNDSLFYLIQPRLFFNQNSYKNKTTKIIAIDCADFYFDNNQINEFTKKYLSPQMKKNLTTSSNTIFFSTDKNINFLSLLKGISPFAFSNTFPNAIQNNYLEMLNKYFRNFKLDNSLLKNNFKVFYYLFNSKNISNLNFSSTTILKNGLNYNLKQLNFFFQDFIFNLKSKNFFYIKLPSKLSNHANEKIRTFKLLKEFFLFLESKNLLKNTNIYFFNSDPQNLTKITNKQLPFLFYSNKNKIAKNKDQIKLNNIAKYILQKTGIKTPKYLLQQKQSFYNILTDNDYFYFHNNKSWLAKNKLNDDNVFKHNNNSPNIEMIQFATNITKHNNPLTTSITDYFKEIIITNNLSIQKNISLKLESKEFFILSKDLEQYFKKNIKYKRNKKVLEIILKPNESKKILVYYKNYKQKFSVSLNNYVDFYYGKSLIYAGNIKKFNEISSERGIKWNSKEYKISPKKNTLSLTITNYPAYLIN